MEQPLKSGINKYQSREFKKKKLHSYVFERQNSEIHNVRTSWQKSNLAVVFDPTKRWADS